MKFSLAVVASVMAFALAASAAPAPQAAPATSPNVKTNPVGGAGGSPFDDLNKIPLPVTVKSYTVKAGARIDNVAVTVTGANGDLTIENGGGGGSATTLTMQPGEFVTRMDVSIDEQEGSQRVFVVASGSATVRFSKPLKRSRFSRRNANGLSLEVDHLFDQMKQKKTAGCDVSFDAEAEKREPMKRATVRKHPRLNCAWKRLYVNKPDQNYSRRGYLRGTIQIFFADVGKKTVPLVGSTGMARALSRGLGFLR